MQSSYGGIGNNERPAPNLQQHYCRGAPLPPKPSHVQSATTVIPTKPYRRVHEESGRATLPEDMMQPVMLASRLLLLVVVFWCAASLGRRKY